MVITGESKATRVHLVVKTCLSCSLPDCVSIHSEDCPLRILRRMFRRYNRRAKKQTIHLPKPTAKKCVRCGRYFLSSFPFQRFCSSSCRSIAFVYRKLGMPEERPTGRVCLTCGSSIDHRRQSAVFCSKKCRKQYPNRHLLNIKRSCPVCGKDISDKRIKDVCCSKKCSRENCKEKHKAQSGKESNHTS